LVHKLGAYRLVHKVVVVEVHMLLDKVQDMVLGMVVEEEGVVVEVVVAVVVEEEVVAVVVVEVEVGEEVVEVEVEHKRMEEGVVDMALPYKVVVGEHRHMAVLGNE